MVLTWLKHMFQKREDYYNSIDCTNDGNTDSENEEDEMLQGDDLGASCTDSGDDNEKFNGDELDGRKFIMVVGSAGTGNSYAIRKAIESTVASNQGTLVATPTGYLATEYKDKFGVDIDKDTIHGAFQYPVYRSQRPTYNWNIASYDLVVIDELSMVPKKIFEHVAATISEVAIRPIVLLAGDERQLQPIETVDDQINVAESIMHSDEIKPLTMKLRQ